MSNPILVFILAAMLSTAVSAGAAPRPSRLTSVPLTADWEFRQAGHDDWHRATVPGCVHTDLLANELIPDPFVGENETSLQWIGKTDWEYRVRFDVPHETLTREHVELVFGGLDTYATVRLNGTVAADVEPGLGTRADQPRPYLYTTVLRNAVKLASHFVTVLSGPVSFTKYGPPAVSTTAAFMR